MSVARGKNPLRRGNGRSRRLAPSPIRIAALFLLFGQAAQAALVDCTFRSICRGDAPCITSSGLLAQLEVIDDLAELTFTDVLRITGPMNPTGQQFTSTAQDDSTQTAVILSRAPDGTAALTVHSLGPELVVETFHGTCEAPR